MEPVCYPDNSLNSTEDVSCSNLANMSIVVKNIYMSCDTENTDSVPVSKLIGFIKPYMMEDLNALEKLRSALDPSKSDICVTSNVFYEVMDEWSKTIANSSDEDAEFNKTPKNFDEINEKDLPYVQSTPRASFGQKLLSNKGLLNLSDVSSYSLSTSKTNETVENFEKTMLEEEVKRLEHQLTKVSSDLVMVKIQLTASEEQNDALQSDLEKLNRKLHNTEQQLNDARNDAIQKERKCNEDLKEELNIYKKRNEELSKKTSLQEKENHQLSTLLKEAEHEKSELEKKCESISRREQEAKKEIYDIKTELDIKEQDISTMIQLNNNLKMQLKEHKDKIDNFTNEKDMLIHTKNSLEKTLRDYKSDCSKSFIALSLANTGTPDELNSQNSCSFNSPRLLAQLQNPITSTIETPKNLFRSVAKRGLKHKGLSNGSNLKSEGTNSKDNSSNLSDSDFLKDAEGEEELTWKNSGGPHESLHSEICKAEGMGFTNISLLLFEKDEKIVELETEHQNCQTTIENLNAKTEKLEDEVQLLQEKLNTVNQELEKEKAELEHKLETNQLKALTENIQTTTAKVEEQIDRKNRAIRELVDLNKALESRVSLKESELHRKIDEVTQLKNKLQMDAEMNKDMWESQRKLKCKIENLEKSRDEVYAQLQRETALHNELRMAYNDLRDKLNAEVDKNSELESMINDVNEVTAAFEERLKDKSKTCVELNEKLSILTEEVENLHHQLNREITENASLTGQLISKTKENRVIEESTKSLQKQIKTLKSELEFIRIANDKYQVRFQQLNMEMITLRVQNDALTEQLESSKKNVVSFSTNSIKKKKYSHETIYIKLLKKRLVKLKNKTKKEKRRRKAVSGRMEHYKIECTNKHQVLLSLKEQLELLQSKYDEQDKKLQQIFIETVAKDDEIDGLKQRLYSLQLELEEQANTQQQNGIEYILEKERKLASLTQQVTEKEKKLQQTFVEMVAKDDEIDSLKQRLYSLQLKLEEQANIQQQNDIEHIQEKERKLASLTQQVTEKEKKMQQTFIEMVAKDDEIDTLKLVLQGLQLDIEKQSRQQNDIEYIQEKEEEVTNLKHQVIEKENKFIELEQKLQLAEQQKLESEREIEMLTQKLIHVEEENCVKLTESETKILTLNTKLVEVENKKNEADTERAALCLLLKELEQDNQNKISNLEEEIRSLRMISQSDDSKQQQLHSLEENLRITKEMLNAKEQELTSKERHLNDLKMVTTVIDQIFKELHRAIFKVFDCWEKLDYLSENLEKACRDLKMLETREFCIENLGNDLELFKKQTKIAVSILDYVATRYLIPMEDVNSNHKNSPSGEKRTIHKFTLCAPKLITTQSLSPDSPSSELDVNAMNCSRDIFNSSDSSKEITSSKTETSDTKSVIHYSTETVQLNFNTLPDEFLAKLEYHSPSDLSEGEHTKDEIEVLFRLFTNQLTEETVEEKGELQKQRNLLSDEHEKFISLLRTISCRLRDHICIGTSEPIAPVFVFLEELKLKTDNLLRLSGQYAILSYESRLARWWNVVNNYVTVLKEETNSLRSQVESPKNSGTFQIRRRFWYSKNDDSTQKVESIENEEPNRSKRSICGKKILLTLLVLSVFTIFLVATGLHLYCRMTVSENQMCPLDVFVTQKRVGAPPH